MANPTSSLHLRFPTSTMCHISATSSAHIERRRLRSLLQNKESQHPLHLRHGRVWNCHRDQGPRGWESHHSSFATSTMPSMPKCTSGFRSALTTLDEPPHQADRDRPRHLPQAARERLSRGAHHDPALLREVRSLLGDRYVEGECPLRVDDARGDQCDKVWSAL